MKKRTWAAYEEEILIDMRNRGKSRTQVARRLNRSVMSVTRHEDVMYRRGLVFVRQTHKAWSQEMDDELRKMRADGMSIKEIAEATGRTDNSVRVRCQLLKISICEHRHHWTRDQLESAVELLNGGMRDCDVAERLGCKRSALQTAKRTYMYLTLRDL